MNQEKVVTVLLIILFTASVMKTGLDINQGGQEAKPENFTAQTIQVVDGDTIDINRNGVEDTVRILGIDTPETQGQNTPTEFGLENTSENQRCLRKMGEKASQLAKNKLANKTIKVAIDPRSDRRGTYGRLLAYIEYNQTDLGEEMLEKGYARVYNSKFTKKQKYRTLETESRQKQTGIWNQTCGAS